MTDESPEQQPAPALVAELWYEQPPELHDGTLLTALREFWPAAEAQGSSLTVPDPTSRIDDQDRPLLTVVMAGSPLGTEGKSRPDVSQTWDWPEAEAAVARGRGSLLVTELLMAGSTPQQRVTALTAVVAELARHTGPVAISWPRSQRVTDPAQFSGDDLDGVINVRLFTVAGEPDVMVMDTLGLYVFGLPDVQCHFRDRAPGEIAAMLFATGSYIFESGDVILDGNTISAPDGEGRYVCRREPALLEPARTVLDVDLGDPYAAGERDRG
jgi:hypothetical protein